MPQREVVAAFVLLRFCIKLLSVSL